jgi:hypothetical protein
VIALQIYDALAFFNGAGVDTDALFDFLHALGARKMWDDEEIALHAHYTGETRRARRQAFAMKYLESLL